MPQRALYASPGLITFYGATISSQHERALPMKTIRRSASLVALLFFLCLHLSVPDVLASDGFGAAATGGAGGASVTVSNATDLLTYAQSAQPYVIRVSGTITYAGYISIASNKTVQGVDTNATINGDLLVGGGVRNVIIRNLNFTNPGHVGDGDGVTIQGSRNVFVTHCTFTDCADGSCDVSQQADSVTISWCRFRYVNQTTHRNVNLIGSSDAAPDLGFLHVTFHHCWYDQGCDERMPSVRFGRVHVYNNYYSSPTGSYGVRTRLSAECRVENNWFENTQNPWELLTTSGSPDGKLFAANNNVAFLDSLFGIRWRAGWYTAPGQTTVLIPGTDSVFTPPYQYAPDSASVVKSMVMQGAGNSESGLLGVRDPDARPARFTLFQNYPNPFNPTTEISYQLSANSFVTLGVYDILGRTVATLVQGKEAPGRQVVRFDASGLSSGVYFYRLTADPATGAGRQAAVKKLVVLK